MREPLTEAQTETLKRLRKVLSKLESLAEVVSSTLATACHCEMEPESCYICAILSTVYDFEPIIGRAAIQLDAALEEREFPEWSST